MATLSTINHDRKIFDKKYIYPVVSRRAGGLSLGINLNTNNACNWQCIYCEIPNLTRGKPEAIDIPLLKKELYFWLEEITQNNFLSKHTNPGTAFKDIAFSGNGEPTAAKEFSDIVSIVVEAVKDYKLESQLTMRIITNGSNMCDKSVQSGWDFIQSMKKEVWFKIDSVIHDEVKLINQINGSLGMTAKNLEASLSVSPTIIQTCLIKMNGQLPSNKSINAYIAFLKHYEDRLSGIHLYSLARPSEQNISIEIERLTESELDQIADKIRVLNVPVFAYI